MLHSLCNLSEVEGDIPFTYPTITFVNSLHYGVSIVEHPSGVLPSGITQRRFA